MVNQIDLGVGVISPVFFICLMFVFVCLFISLLFVLNTYILISHVGLCYLIFLGRWGGGGE